MNKIERSILYTVFITFVVISIGSFIYMQPSVVVPIVFTSLGIIGMLLIAVAIYVDRYKK